MKSIAFAVCDVMKKGGYEAAVGYTEYLLKMLEEWRGLTEDVHEVEAIGVLAMGLEVGLITCDLRREEEERARAERAMGAVKRESMN